MTFSQYAGTAIVPTLARIVLAAAFISTGWNKVFVSAEYTAEEAARLKHLNVTAEPVRPVVLRPLAPIDKGGAGSIVLTAYRATLQDQDQDAPPPATEPAQPPASTPPDAPSDEQPPTQDQAAPADSASADPNAPLPEGTYRASGMYKVALLLSEHGIREPVWMARIAAFTELLGGSMLLIGLFSRLWGLALAGVMGVAFYLVTMQDNGFFTMLPWDFALDIPRFNTAFTQAGLFVLAFGILLTGPGPLSIDRILFGGPRAPEEEVEVKID